MAKPHARMEMPSPADHPDVEDAAGSADPSVMDDEMLISSAAAARRDGTPDSAFVAELAKRAASKNRAALDRLAR